jgi:hypothetical protein
MTGPVVKELDIDADFTESLFSKTKLKIETALRNLDVHFE